jgi:hypothetical protein
MLSICQDHTESIKIIEKLLKSTKLYQETYTSNNKENISQLNILHDIDYVNSSDGEETGDNIKIRKFPEPSVVNHKEDWEGLM